MIIAELWRGGECIGRWTDEDGPSDLAEMLPMLRELGWTVHDFRPIAGIGAGMAASADGPHTG